MRRTRRILVVDDSADGRESMADVLRLKGYEVAEAADGPAALSVVPTFTPDVILLDIALPGMDGFEVAARLRAMPQTNFTLIIGLSGYGRHEIGARAKEAGIDHTLPKPLDFTELERLLAS